MAPAVSVLLPVFNGAPWIAAAIESVLVQTETDLELIVVDDGSTDATWERVCGFRDDRLAAVGTAHQGTTRALNAGLRLCRAPLVARLDADDVMREDRLECQRVFLDTHPDVGVVGSWSTLRWSDGHETLDDRPPMGPSFIRRELGFRNPMAHSTVMMRRALVERVGGYDESFPVAQDYALWAELSRITDFYNIPVPLTTRRMHDGQVSRRRPWARRWAQMRVRAGLFFGPAPAQPFRASTA